MHPCVRREQDIHTSSDLCIGVAKAVDAVIDHLKKISRDVTTPEEITQVCARRIPLI